MSAGDIVHNLLLFLWSGASVECFEPSATIARLCLCWGLQLVFVLGGCLRVHGGYTIHHINVSRSTCTSHVGVAACQYREYMCRHRPLRLPSYMQYLTATSHRQLVSLSTMHRLMVSRRGRLFSETSCSHKVLRGKGREWLSVHNGRWGVAVLSAARWIQSWHVACGGGDPYRNARVLQAASKPNPASTTLTYAKKIDVYPLTPQRALAGNSASRPDDRNRPPQLLRRVKEVATPPTTRSAGAQDCEKRSPWLLRRPWDIAAGPTAEPIRAQCHQYFSARLLGQLAGVAAPSTAKATEARGR